jgi:hypothetical protein
MICFDFSFFSVVVQSLAVIPFPFFSLCSFSDLESAVRNTKDEKQKNREHTRDEKHLLLQILRCGC